MDEEIRQIAERLKGLRDALDLEIADVAADCGLSVDEYAALESGEHDLSVSLLQRIARKYGITLDELMFGEEPKMKSYFLTRKGTGISVERTKAYKYELLASGFIGRTADPFIVTVEPKPAGTPVHFNTHKGQEFHLVMDESGRQSVFRLVKASRIPGTGRTSRQIPGHGNAIIPAMRYTATAYK